MPNPSSLCTYVLFKLTDRLSGFGLAQRETGHSFISKGYQDVCRPGLSKGGGNTLTGMRCLLETEKNAFLADHKNGMFAAPFPKRMRAASLVDRLRSSPYDVVFAAGAPGAGGKWFLFVVIADCERKDALSRTDSKTQRAGTWTQKAGGFQAPPVMQELSLSAKAGLRCEAFWTQVADAEVVLWRKEAAGTHTVRRRC